jgi:hypothetical protein
VSAYGRYIPALRRQVKVSLLAVIFIHVCACFAEKTRRFNLEMAQSLQRNRLARARMKKSCINLQRQEGERAALVGVAGR